jgi:hypothetical protein
MDSLRGTASFDRRGAAQINLFAAADAARLCPILPHSILAIALVRLAGGGY